MNRVFMTIWDGGGTDTYDLRELHERPDDRPDAGRVVDPVRRCSARRSADGHFASGNVYNALQYKGDARSLIENVRAGSGDDEVLGNAASNGIDGGEGNDTLSGGAGDDVIDGGGGNDLIYGGPGRDDITRRRRQRHPLRQQRRRPDGRRRGERHLLRRRPDGVRLRVRGAGRGTR